MEDRAAIRECQTGDREAFRHLVEKYQSQALGHAASILGNRDDALDAVQEAFWDAFQGLGRFDCDRAFYPWFYVILRNRCYKLLSSRRRTAAEPIDALQLLSEQDECGVQTVALERALMALEPEDRELLLLKHLDGLSYAELAERLVIPAGTVMSRLYTARKRLARQLARSGLLKTEVIRR
jgi:RNA polymerase sigma-70 factor (ECF subfamily)